jgi:hypothetical protein
VEAITYSVIELEAITCDVIEEMEAITCDAITCYALVSSFRT